MAVRSLIAQPGIRKLCPERTGDSIGANGLRIREVGHGVGEKYEGRDGADDGNEVELWRKGQQSVEDGHGG